MDNFDLKKYLAEGRINLSEAVFKVTQEFEAVEDPNFSDRRAYVSVKDNGKGGEWIVDPNQKKYTPGTLQIIAVLEEQEFEWENAEDYFEDVAAMQAFKDVDDAEDYIYDNFGTDFIDELELHRSWEDAMFPRPDESPFMEENKGKLNEQLDLSSREYPAKKLFALIARDLKFSSRVQDNEMLDADEALEIMRKVIEIEGTESSPEAALGEYIANGEL